MSSMRTIWLNTSTLRGAQPAGQAWVAGASQQADACGRRVPEGGSPPATPAQPRLRLTDRSAPMLGCAPPPPNKASDNTPPPPHPTPPSTHTHTHTTPPHPPTNTHATHLCPVACRRRSSLSSSTILPEVSTRRPATSSSPPARSRYSSSADWNRKLRCSEGGGEARRD
jgi:hypothetical protein